MGSANNSIPAYSQATAKELQESIGITQFPSENEWNQIIGGLIFQGGRVPAITGDSKRTIQFNYPIPKKVLNIQITTISPDGVTVPTARYAFAVYNITLTSFDIVNDGITAEFYWLAIGI